MIHLRCTGRLLRRIGAKPVDNPAPPTSRLGDWYASLLIVQRQWLVLFVAERTLFPLVLPYREKATLVSRLRQSLIQELAALGVEDALLEGERDAMQTVGFARTASRSILGSMNDFRVQIDYRIEAGSWNLRMLSRELAETPCSPIQYRDPESATRELFDVSGRVRN